MVDVLPFASAVGRHALFVDGSRIYDVDEETFDDILAGRFDAAPALAARPYVDGVAPAPPPLHALSLNVAQACNLACRYCYADRGHFGEATKVMSAETAIRAVELLLREAEPAGRAVLGFMGGEPLLNRPLVRAVTEWASGEAARRGIDLRFSLTTNATMVTEDDAAFFAAHRFTANVSLDGPAAVNDALRPDKRGRGSTAAAREGLARLLAADGARVSIRATVTPRSGPLLATLRDLVATGAESVGFAPVLVSPDPDYAFDRDDIAGLLAEMITCGEAARDAILAGGDLPFSNFTIALGEIARGTHRPYPCGAGAGYGSVAADGGLYACHRAVNDDRFAMGDVLAGPDHARRSAFLASRHVLAQEPCRSCWARFMCGGGCHHEVVERGRPACDYIRGWLTFLLASYAEISTLRPDYFAGPPANDKGVG
ncbi:radical SAM/SPASM domain-containing protein [Acuticoccus sediminis]|uniref:radical SAM/SPASM domain-containing protein n=1 Tax=Acuticoccus sediminis TaxID=2184697 RepID=UPI001CFC6B69|nr:radical SAM protein [Acuticoccus sediminis]